MEKLWAYDGVLETAERGALIKMNPELHMFPSSHVGGRPRPRRSFTDPFLSLVPS
uniref:Uncharacterized protein n=1 Tax=Brassica oleracea TaxID=3712 RepID=A0A3P6G2U2_BRAOL|nr:unnamed protein product [Brassica oleracea]